MIHPLRILVVAASNRRRLNCSGLDSKARMLTLRMKRRLPKSWKVDLEDLGNVPGRPGIQACNSCVSTSMALCVWPCNCYSRGDAEQPDLMWDRDLYARLEAADAWAFVGPVNWYGPTSNLKLMFDRLVCMNGGNPRPELIDGKDPAKARALEHRSEWRELSVNHLEGRTAGFFCYGDGGGDEIGPDGRPRALIHKAWFDPAREPFRDMRDTYAPLVWQCRYGGVEVPDRLWRYVEFGRGLAYSDNQADHLAGNSRVLGRFDAWADAFARYVRQKGKVPPGRWRVERGRASRVEGRERP
ncbi:MAG: NAD(P)H-dependent oxidoreductase [Planctomycetes bacterium]|nr:NAD(P)H-dependent oxidoreductase [Planctomycetota bacterium]